MWQESGLTLLLAAVLLAGCGPSGSEVGRTQVETGASTPPTQAPGSETPRRTPAPTATVERPQSETLAPSATPVPDLSAVCSDMADQVGRTVTCVVPRAHCSYREDVSGSPTFCNDAPYPTHEFTLLVWGQDWSEFDGRCIEINGYLSRYQGKPQIVAESRDQVSFCD